MPYTGSRLLHELRLQAHRADAVDLAIDVVIAFDEPDVLDLCADLDHERGTLDLQILDDGDAIAVLEDVADRIANCPNLRCFGEAFLAPFVRAFGADVHRPVFVGVFGIALRALGQSRHEGNPKSKTANP